MIVIRYRGGLGNQMFQYAFSLAMRQRYGEVPVLADLTHYRLNREHNGFELGEAFGIHPAEASERDIRRLSPYYVPPFAYEKLPGAVSFVNRLQYRCLERQRRKKAGNYYKQENHCAYEPAVFELDPGHDWYLDGLWQDPDYFRNCKTEIAEAYSFRNRGCKKEQDKTLREKITGSHSVGVHVRRGDFVNSKFDICSVDYYRQAFGIMEQKVSEPFFFFFSDDAEYVEKEFGEIRNKEIISGGPENGARDMELLSLCRYAIVSNSTFAWWGAWLGHAELVLAPRYSIVNHGQQFRFPAPKNWIQM